MNKLITASLLAASFSAPADTDIKPHWQYSEAHSSYGAFITNGENGVDIHCTEGRQGIFLTTVFKGSKGEAVLTLEVDVDGAKYSLTGVMTEGVVISSVTSDQNGVAVLKGLIKGSKVNITAGPYSSTFNLKGSEAAISKTVETCREKGLI